MKKEDRASLSVSKATRERFMRALAKHIGKRGEILTQDEVVTMLLDLDDKHNA